jgi:hypothetical protein
MCVTPKSDDCISAPSSRPQRRLVGSLLSLLSLLLLPTNDRQSQRKSPFFEFFVVFLLLESF